MTSRVPRQLTLLGLSILVATFGLFGLVGRAQAQSARATLVGPRAYYLGLGDSLAFGYQPDLNWDDGYVQDFYYGNLQARHVTSLTNYGCNGETSTTMITGGCPYAFALHNYYFEPQLTAAVGFLHAHAGQVSPVTLDMGANDLLPDINGSTCVVAARWATDLQTLTNNLNNTILPELVAAMTNSQGHRTGDLVLMNYYDPYSKTCPNSLSYVQSLNTVIANAAARYHLPVANVYGAFGGASMGANICNNTWICSFFHDVHAKDVGYHVIANAFAAATGY